MDIQLADDVENISWEELARVIELAPLGKRDIVKLETAFRNSEMRCFAYHDEKLIGAGRGISDGALRAAIYDVVVLPQYQGKGIGTMIMEYLLVRANAEITMLFANPGKEPFYGRIGFHKMKTAMAITDNPELLRAKGMIE
ncbi:MAG: GNAT family N-acetyltransferase [Nitrospirae bacterium]|nr:GNAT family N-acetyltransferase [Nitrospirota bacterium]